MQRLSGLLDEIRLLISRDGLRFTLCGSSARRCEVEETFSAVRLELQPLTSAEIPEFSLDRAQTVRVS